MWGALFLMATGLSADAVVVKGAPSDALVRPANPAEIWVTATTNSGRVLQRVGSKAPIRAVDADAIFVDATRDASGARFVFVKKTGLFDEEGQALIEGPGIFSLTDPERLYALPSSGPGGELRFFIADGIVVRAPDGRVTKLRYPHKARLYSGRTQRGLNPQKRYAAALSTYAPRIFDVDVDADQDRDAVVLLHDTAMVFLRGPDGMLAKRPATTLSLRGRLPGTAGEDLHVIVGDVDGDRRADLVIGAHKGRLPEKSSAYWVHSSSKTLWGNADKMWTKDGFVEPLAVMTGSRRVLVSSIDTSYVSLGSVLVSGTAGVEMLSLDTTGKQKAAGPTVEVGVDVRRGQMAGAMPITDVDFDGNGKNDLLAFTEQAAWLYLAGPDGEISKTTAGKARVNLFVHSVPLPEARAVVLIHPTKKATGQVTVLRYREDAGGRGARWRR